jgi:glycosyltransferase involved in cell wall biosynthesis
VDVEQVEAGAARRAEMRGRFGWSDDHVVLVYAGKFSTWYMAAEMAQLFAALRALVPSARFLVLTQSPPELILDELDRVGVPRSAVVVTRVDPVEVGAHLSAADLAVSFIMPSPSKVASSPTKLGEYLAAGLPVIVGAGVGDTDAIVERERVGVVVHAHGFDDHEAALRAALALRAETGIADRCRSVARQELSLRDVGIPRYRALYERIAARRAQRGR